jgi:Sulfotransferase family
MTRNPYVFVVACPRSGTTLLQRMLDAHPQLAVANDADFIPFAPGVLDGGDPPVTPELVEWLLGYRTFARLALDEDTVWAAAEGAATYRELVAALYDAFGAERGKPLVGEKAPGYVHYIPLLHDLFPRAHVTHLIRDGRDVALSLLDWARPDNEPGRFRLWKDNPLAVSALCWQQHVTLGRREGGRLGELYSEVRYEELVAEPEATMRRLAGQLELPFSERMLAFHVGRDEPRLPAKRTRAARAVRNWRVQLSHDDQQLFEALAGDLLSQLGYERRFDPVAPGVLAAAARYRAAWESELVERGDLRPRVHDG